MIVNQIQSEFVILQQFIVLSESAVSESDIVVAAGHCFPGVARHLCDTCEDGHTFWFVDQLAESWRCDVC